MLTISIAFLSFATVALSAPRSSTLRIPISKRFDIRDDSGVANIGHLEAAYDMSTSKYEQNEITRLNWTNDNITLKRRQAQALKSQNNGMLWTGLVGFGTPPVFLPINFDTGSDDLWVKGYDPSQSSSAKVINGQNDAFKIAYADKSGAQGPVYQETIQVGGLNVLSQTFSPVTSTNGMSGRPDAGMCGLAFRALSQLNAPNIVEPLFSQGSIASKSFSFALKKGDGASLCLGCIDKNAISAPILYTPVLDSAYWLVHGDVFIAGVQQNTAVSSSQGMIIDTGTTLLVAPANAAEHIWSLVPSVTKSSVGAGYYEGDCNNIPLVSIEFGGRQYQIPASSMNLGSTYAGSGRCVLSLVAGHVGVNDWIVGDAFLQNVYATFDYAGNQVGFAPLK